MTRETKAVLISFFYLFFTFINFILWTPATDKVHFYRIMLIKLIN